jgi:antirestriction protein
VVVRITEHVNVLSGIFSQLKEIFNSSEQAMYLYLDDDHKLCNEKFAFMLNYESAEEWAAVKASFPDAFVAEKSRATLISTYQNAMEKGIGASIEVEWKKKSGETVKTNVILVPLAYEGHRMALHFISESG